MCLFRCAVAAQRTQQAAALTSCCVPAPCCLCVCVSPACSLAEHVDFVACLGGDGVILHASSLFKHHIPPVVSFHLGSMGFLTNHNFKEFKQELRQVGGGGGRRMGLLGGCMSLCVCSQAG